MQIAKSLAGFSPAEADDLRKAIGKKSVELMASLKDRFIEGCVANAVPKPTAELLWGENERSADYSFNKSHAACYALISYRTAYLKANYPARVHGGADLVRHGHEGQGPVLRRRVRRHGHRGAAAGRQLVAARLRGGRGQGAVRPVRGQERRGERGAGDPRGARRGRAVPLGVGVLRARRHAAGVPRACSTAWCERARSTPPARRARGSSRWPSRRSRRAASRRPTGSPGRARSSTSSRSPTCRRPRRTRPSPTSSSTSASCCRPSATRSGCTSRATRWPTSATSSAARSTAVSASSPAGARATAWRSGASSRRCAST